MPKSTRRIGQLFPTTCRAMILKNYLILRVLPYLRQSWRPHRTEGRGPCWRWQIGQFHVAQELLRFRLASGLAGDGSVLVTRRQTLLLPLQNEQVTKFDQ